MNRQIGTLFRLAAIGIALLITITAYWQIWAASSLASRRDNARLVYRQLQIKRGLILASNGHTVLARNHAVHRDGLTLYERRYPFGALFAHAIGYNTVGDGRTALELAENPYLTASNSNLATVISNLSSTLQGETVTGDNVITSLSVHAQRAAQQGLSGLVGAVVALEPSTGRVIAMYSSPSFNPTQVDQNFARLNRVGGAPLLNRVTQGLYAPGSTFKIVTATAALQAGTNTDIDAMGHCIIDEGSQLCNAGTESYGFIDLKTALTFSVNTTSRNSARRWAKRSSRTRCAIRLLPAAAVHLSHRRDEPQRPLLARAPARGERAGGHRPPGDRPGAAAVRPSRWPRSPRRSETAGCAWRRAWWTRS